MHRCTSPKALIITGFTRTASRLLKLTYVQKLVANLRIQQFNLNVRTAFGAIRFFRSTFALASEVASKRVSSEKDTHTNQCLVTLLKNIRGNYSRFQLFATELGDVKLRSVKNACELEMRMGLEAIRTAKRSLVWTIVPLWTVDQSPPSW